MADPGDLSVYRGTRTLVLGAGGFIGQWVSRALQNHDAELIAAVRNTGSVRFLREHGIASEYRIVDLSRAGAASDLLRTLKPEIVFNLAGYGVDPTERDEPSAQRLNRDLVSELSESVRPQDRWQGQLLVHAGSALEFGFVSGNLASTWECSPTTSYGRTKLEGSTLLRDISTRRGVRAICARLFTVYGPGEHRGRLLPSLIDAAQAGSDIQLTEGIQQRDFTYVADVAEGLLRLGAVQERFPPCALNLATGKLCSVREFATQAAAAFRLPQERLRFGALPSRSEEMVHEPVSTSDLERLVGWKPLQTIGDGVHATSEYMRRESRR